MDYTAASASSLVPAGGTQTFMPAGDTQTQVGPCLYEGMGEPSLIATLNAWGSARDRELLGLKAGLATAQVIVSTTFDQAKETLLAIVVNFRTEAETLRQHGQYEAVQSVARLEHVVAEARQRFDAQEVRFSHDLGELVRRQQAVEAWAQAEPTRVAAIVQAAPAPPWVQPQVVTSPGGTVTFYPSPGPAGPMLPPRGPMLPPVPTVGLGPPPVPTTPPLRSAQPNATPAWDAWAAGRGVSPQGQPPHDAWAAATAQPGEPRHSYMNTPGGDGGRPREMRLDARGWSASKLDIGMTFDGFQVWKDRAMMFLSRERPDVRKLLCWAETQTKETLEGGLVAQAALFNVLDLAGVEYAIHDGIKMTITDTLLGRARNCLERGCELWRSLCAEWSGAAPQLQHAKARRYQNPPTCKNVQELWSRLPAWERLGEEVALSGLALPPWLACSALEQLLPAQLRDSLVMRDELKTFAQRLAWVKTQMEHARGLAQATAYGPGVGKDPNGDVHMYSVDGPPGIAPDAVEGLSWALAESVQAGDWDLADQLQNTIYALKGSKGGGGRKGLGKGKPGKGGAAPAAAAKGGGHTFDGACRHCGMWGHRMSECRRLTAELAKKGGPKGKAGGKGGPKGGKGPIKDPLLEVTADDDWAGDWAGEIGADTAAAELAEWDFDTAICSLAADHCDRNGADRVGQLRPADHCDRNGAGRAGPAQTQTFAVQPAGRTQTFSGIAAASAAASASGLAMFAAGAGKTGKVTLPWVSATKTQNSFAALSLFTDDAEALLGAVSGDVRGGRIVEAIVDSGAVHSVTPPGLFPGPMVPSPWSRAGRGYRAANGTGIKNLGQVTVKFATAAGDRCSIPFQVAEVEQPLLSVAHLASAGNRVELGHASGRVVNTTTGRAIALERRGGVYIMKMYIADGAAPAPFRRQGA